MHATAFGRYPLTVPYEEKKIISFSGAVKTDDDRLWCSNDEPAVLLENGHPTTSALSYGESCERLHFQMCFCSLSLLIRRKRAQY